MEAAMPRNHLTESPFQPITGNAARHIVRVAIKRWKELLRTGASRRTGHPD
jgi:hypothetical protein